MSAACEKCGAFGQMPHSWVESDCVLPHKGHPRATVGHCCAGCVDRHKTWLSEITDLYATLAEVVDAGSVPDDTAEHGHQRKQPASPSPLRLDAWAMLHDTNRLRPYTLDEHGTGHPAYLGRTLPDVPAVLAGWADWAYDTLGYSGAPSTVSGAAAALTAHAGHIAAQPWIDEYDAELGWLRRSLRNAHGISDPQNLGECITVTDGRECGGRVWPGSPKPKCDRCGRLYGTLDCVRLKAMNRESA